MLELFKKLKTLKVSAGNHNIHIGYFLFITIPSALGPLYDSLFDKNLKGEHINGSWIEIGWILISIVIICFLLTKQYLYYIIANVTVAILTIYTLIIYIHTAIAHGYPIIITAYGHWVFVAAIALKNLSEKVITYTDEDVFEFLKKKKK